MSSCRDPPGGEELLLFQDEKVGLLECTEPRAVEMAPGAGGAPLHHGGVNVPRPVWGSQRDDT